MDNVPAVEDMVGCGGGFDRVLADRKDTVGQDCERVVVRGSREAVLRQEEEFFESVPEGFFAGLQRQDRPLRGHKRGEGEGPGLWTPALLSLIHPTSGKGRSRNFGLRGFSEVRVP